MRASLISLLTLFLCIFPLFIITAKLNNVPTQKNRKIVKDPVADVMGFLDTVDTQAKAKVKSSNKGTPDGKQKSKMPPALDSSNFDIVTSQQLTLVEFFSPYCSHCKKLAPIWEETYHELKRTYPDLNIDMRQVNCVESGDLCDRESIQFYPNILLYAPATNDKGNRIPKELNNVGSFPRTLKRTKEDIIKYLRESVAKYDSGAIGLPSASKILNTDQVLNIIAGKINTPTFLAFFPAKKKDIRKGRYPRLCFDCQYYKQEWDVLSNKIISVAETGHVSCIDSPKLCKSLGFDMEKSPNMPKFAMFLPKSVGLVRFDYDGKIDSEAMKNWATRLFYNSRFETISPKAMHDIMEFRGSLPQKPIQHEFPVKNRVSVLFYYDPDTISSEDKAVLPYLLNSLQKSPFNVQLYTAKASKFEDIVESMGKNLVNFINYDESATKYKFDKGMHISTTLSSKPTILVFKDNSLIVDVYQSIAPEDLRIYERVEKFIERVQYPLHQQLTGDLLPHYFSRDNNKKNYKVVVTFIDTNDTEAANDALYQISLAAHEYHHLKKKYYYDKLIGDRRDKNSRVEKLKQANADSLKIVQAMRDEVPHYWDSDEVLFTYIDKSTAKKEFSDVKGWKINADKYKVGDTIIISKDNRYYWDQDRDGGRLTNDARSIRQVLLSLLDPSLPRGKIRTRVLGSPFAGYFQFMDPVHDAGILGYLGLIILMYVALFGVRKIRRLRRRKRTPLTGQQNLGILGQDISKKDVKSS